MKYSVEKFKIDLGETPIENIFLNQYLQVATGNQLKVYLYCYKLAKDTSANVDISDEEIAKALDLTESEVSECWMRELSNDTLTHKLKLTTRFF